MRVVGWAVKRLDAEQLSLAIAEHRELAALDRAADRRVVMAGSQPRDLQAQLALLAPEPRQRRVGTRLAENAVGDATGVVGGVLHRFEAGHIAAGMRRRVGAAIADRRDRRV